MYSKIFDYVVMMYIFPCECGDRYCGDDVLCYYGFHLKVFMNEDTHTCGKVSQLRHRWIHLFFLFCLCVTYSGLVGHSSCETGF